MDRKIKAAIVSFRTQEAAFAKQVSEQNRRQYLIVNPSATPEDLSRLDESGAAEGVFRQALLRSDRRGEAQSALGNVRRRHEEIQRIERTLEELARMFEEVDAVVVAQEGAVREVEGHAEQAKGFVVKANVELDGAVSKARSARRKKWMCLGIVVLIVLIAVAIVLIIAKIEGWIVSVLLMMWTE